MHRIIGSIAIWTLVLLSVSCYSVRALPQSYSVAQASATIVIPISISKINDMNFGEIAVISSASGTVIIDPSGSITSGGGGGVTLILTTGSVSSASFNVTGAAGYTYNITLPSGSIPVSCGTNTMDLSSFTCSVSPLGLLSTGGSQLLTVGATLNVPAGQAVGTYSTSSSMPLTVNYNTN
jgi:hypothetical protein